MNNINNNKKDNLSFFLIISIIVVACIILIYSIFTSNKNLNNNSYNSDETNNNNNEYIGIYDRTDGLTDEEIDNMTVDKESVDKLESQNKPKTETEIATFTSTLYDKDTNRVDNITLAISKINNVIVKAGEEFSFNNTVGPMDEMHGFKEAVGFDTDGRKIKVPGGGMCQISSTMYNTALIANLEITERHPHSRRVYYVPKDKDATIYYGSLDFKFLNNTPNDIKIIATNDSTNVTIKFMKLT